MKRAPKSDRPAKEQPRAEEVQEAILRFIQNHFYRGNPADFYRHRNDHLRWVVWKLAVYLDDRAVTISSERYIEIMVGPKGILMEGIRFQTSEKVKYPPAMLGRWVDSHLAVHGEDYYEEGKALRNHLQGALTLARNGIQGRDPIRELADASRLLKLGKKAAFKPASKGQLSLFK